MAGQSTGGRPPVHRSVTSGPGAGGHPQPRHVWVTVTGITEDRHVGILLDWRRDRTGAWEALVVWAAGGGRHAAHARIDWLAVHHVRPASGPPGAR